MRPAFEGALSFVARHRGYGTPGRRGRFGPLRLAPQPRRRGRRRGRWRSTSTSAPAGWLPPASMFAADNAEPFGGGMSQAGRASGGWAEGRFALTRAGTSDRRVRPRSAGRRTRAGHAPGEPHSMFGSATMQFTPELAASLEYRWLETELGLVPVAAREPSRQRGLRGQVLMRRFCPRGLPASRCRLRLPARLQLAAAGVESPALHPRCDRRSFVAVAHPDPV